MSDALERARNSLPAIDNALRYAAGSDFDGAEQEYDALKAARLALAALLAEHEALLRRVADADRLRGLLSDTVAVAITMLYDTHKGDVLATFSKDELAQVVGSTRHLNESNARVESVYRRAWDAVRILAEPGEVGRG